MMKIIQKFRDDIKTILGRSRIMSDSYIFFKAIKLIHSDKPQEVTIYATNRCNSRCINCNIWKIQPKIDLKIEVIKKLLSDPLIKNDTWFMLQGGEFILHPRCEEILELFKHRNYTLFSNGVLSNKLIEIIKRHNIKSLEISLDGTPETHKKIRGIDNFGNIIQIIEELREFTNIGISYTINPLNNNLNDILFVKKICKNYGLGFGVNIYGTPFYFGSNEKKFLIDDKISEEVTSIYNKKYVEDYNRFVFGLVKLPCLSISKQTTIWPNGDISLCQQKNIMLGNLYDNTLSNIWNSKRSKNLRKEHSRCNDCWLSCHRIFDISVIENKTVPKRVINIILKMIMR